MPSAVGFLWKEGERKEGGERRGIERGRAKGEGGN